MVEKDKVNDMINSYHRSSEFTAYVAWRHPLIFNLLYRGYWRYRFKKIKGGMTNKSKRPNASET